MVLSPAYDLLNAFILNTDDEEELVLTDKQIKAAFKRIERNAPKAIEWIDRSFLSEDVMVVYKEVLKERYKQLGINL